VRLNTSDKPEDTRLQIYTMIENPECYKVGEYAVPIELVSLLNNSDWKDHEGILRPSLSSTSRVIYFPSEYTDRYSIELPEMMLQVRNLAINVAQDAITKTFPDYAIIKGEISLLRKLGKQSAHQDPRVFQRFAKRIHLPVITNKLSHLCIDDRRYHMPANTLWTFDNVTGMHYSQNLGVTDRWHIIVDIVEHSKLQYILSKISVDDFYSLWWNWSKTASINLIKELNLEKEMSILTHKTSLYD
jgi:Aspartyl/Asparaginyl beta-hydroxylase